MLDKTIIPDNNTNTTGGIGLLETTPFSNAMIKANILLMVGAYFRMLSISPKVGSSERDLVDIKPDNIGLGYPVEIGLVDNLKIVLSALHHY